MMGRPPDHQLGHRATAYYSLVDRSDRLASEHRLWVSTRGRRDEVNVSRNIFADRVVESWSRAKRVERHMWLSSQTDA
jgi:hypothetical protein